MSEDVKREAGMIDASEIRDGNAAWLLLLIDDMRPVVERLRGRADPEARAQLEKLVKRLERFGRTTANAAADSEQLVLSAGEPATARARK